MAQQGQNISGFNVEVDKYNAWIQQNFGNDQYLIMPKMPEAVYGEPEYTPLQKPTHAIDAYSRPTVYGDPLGWV